MADWVTVSGLAPYDGRYLLDLDEQPLTTREWGWIKKHAGYLPLTLTGAAFADPELVAVLAVVAVRRGGRIEVGEVPALVERLADAPFGTTVTLDTDVDAEAEDEDGPPALSSAEKRSSSGTSSPNGSASSDAPPSPTGPPASDTSLSAPAMSVT